MKSCEASRVNFLAVVAINHKYEEPRTEPLIWMTEASLYIPNIQTVLNGYDADISFFTHFSNPPLAIIS
jgi:hypothetical protein